MADYVTVAGWRTRYDEREIAQLVSDSGEPVDLSDLNTDPVALQILSDAEGEVLAALLAGGRYSTTDLDELTGSALAWLERLICDLAMTMLMERRLEYDPERYAAREKRVQERLKDLRDGKNVFGLPEELAAGTVDLGTPTLAQRTQQTLIRDRTKNYFPANRLPGDLN